MKKNELKREGIFLPCFNGKTDERQRSEKRGMKKKCRSAEWKKKEKKKSINGQRNHDRKSEKN